MFIVVPNEIKERIDLAINRVLDGRSISDKEREEVFNKIVDTYDRTGKIPDFSLVEKTQ